MQNKVFSIRLEGLTKPTKELSQHTRLPGQDLNQRLPEQEKIATHPKATFSETGKEKEENSARDEDTKRTIPRRISTDSSTLLIA
jgi:hypothetical protein